MYILLSAWLYSFYTYVGLWLFCAKQDWGEKGGRAQVHSQIGPREKYPNIIFLLFIINQIQYFVPYQIYEESQLRCMPKKEEKYTFLQNRAP